MKKIKLISLLLSLAVNGYAQKVTVDSDKTVDYEWLQNIFLSGMAKR